MLAALADGASTLVLLDGYYYTVPSVTHKELLYALDAGARVLGAASLGALRAVELAPFGMLGVGRVFEAFRSGALDGDDEVALLHAPAENGYRPLTVALVEVRFTLERLIDSGVVPAGNAGRLAGALKALPFTERDPRRLADLAQKFLGEEAAAALRRELAARSVKAADARQALEMAAAPFRPAALRRRIATGFLTSFKEQAVRGPAPEPRMPHPTLVQAWNLVQILHPGAAGFASRIRTRALLASAGGHAGLEPFPEEEEKVARALERRHERRLGRRLLPWPEYLEEARVRLLAHEACRSFGADALPSLARRRGLDPAIEGEEFLRHLAADPGLVPAWDLTRAFSFTTAFQPALEAAAQAEEVYRCFQRWAGGARVVREDLRRLAAELWGCAPGAVVEEGVQRGLFPLADPAMGLWEVLGWAAPAERLPEAINGYRKKREALLGMSLGPLHAPVELLTLFDARIDLGTDYGPLSH